MAFRPDIVVTDADGSALTLIVEVKTSTADWQRTEPQLKRFMAGMGCPIGLLVTPQKFRLYRDRYLSSSADSVELVAECETEKLLPAKLSSTSRRDEDAFAQAVQAWLEDLRSDSAVRELSGECRRVVQTCLLPALAEGVLRAGHPRPSLTA